MDKKLILDIIGYMGSVFVLASFLMATVKKLRIINSIGSIVTIIYGFLIQAYPTVFMNACLLIINLYYLVKMFRYKEEFHIVEAKIDDGSVKFFLNKNKDDISVFFPEFSDAAKDINYTRIIYCQNKTAGLCVGKLDGKNLAIYLDYTIKEYRDYSVGKYLFAALPKEGISTIELKQKTKHHYQYLIKMGFVREGDRFIKQL
ncbi:MAG: YgjV family protein [Treponemataceae bacterium]|nr:YgjV family protein [Treponemataceae bacterium]